MAVSAAEKARQAGAKELEDFKRRVAEKAVELKNRYDYCDGSLTEFLGELDLPLPKVSHQFSVSFNLNMAEGEDYEILEKVLEKALGELVATNDKFEKSNYRNLGFSVSIDDCYNV